MALQPWLTVLVTPSRELGLSPVRELLLTLLGTVPLLYLLGRMLTVVVLGLCSWLRLLVAFPPA